MTRLFFLLLPALLLAAPVQAQSPQPEGHAMPPGMDHSQHQMMMGAGGVSASASTPTEAGQSAFATIQEILEILDADPETDWGRIDIGALREHLVDMDDVIMRSSATARGIDGGLEIMARGEGRVREALRRMVVAHAPMLAGETGWQARAEKTAAGAKLVVTATKARDIAKIRALGFYGLMATGAHHQPHHLGMARGEMVHGG